MSHLFSGSLLAASMLLGQTGDKTVVPATPAVQQTPTRGPILGWFQREDRPVINRIQGWFRRDQPEAQPQADMSQFRKGDLVSIRGQLVQRPAGNGMIPIYRVTQASLIERPKAL